MEDKRIWELTKKGTGEIIEIPGAAADTVKRRWDNGLPIHTSNGSIDAKMIATFEPTSRLAGQNLLAIEAAQAFGDAIVIDDMTVQASWVKKEVTRAEYQKHYAAIPAYRALESNDGMVTVAFKLATHNVDLGLLSYCTTDEVSKLTK